MTRFFIDIDNGGEKTLDEDGANYADQEVAEQEAFAVLPDLARDNQLHDKWYDIISSVRDEAGKIIFTATLTLTARWAV